MVSCRKGSKYDLSATLRMMSVIFAGLSLAAFCLGVVLYHIGCGKRPNQATNSVENGKVKSEPENQMKRKQFS